MCGIFGYIGKKNAAKNIIRGLKRLEYRGYDSWGIAVINDGEIDVTKQVGAIGELESDNWPDSHLGVGHTRWATHGGVTEVNAHPHYSTDKSFVLAQNGIVENYQELKKALKEKGYKFVSETDTEVIVRLVEDKLKKVKDLREAVRLAFLDLEGRNTIILLSSTGKSKVKDYVVAIRNGSPLVVGVGDGEFFFASDTLSFADKTDKVIFVNDFEMVEYQEGKIGIFDVESSEEKEYEVEEIDHTEVKIDREGYDHFMLKEIVEQKDTVRNAVQYSREDLRPLLEAIKNSEVLYTVGAGTASYEAGQAAYFFRKISGRRAVELKAYEIDSYLDLFSEKDLIIAYSQSGETADTIEALEKAKSRGVRAGSIVNMMGSTITRMSDFPYFVRSGPEICVASTKAFSAKLSWSLLVAYSLVDRYDDVQKAIYDLSEQLQGYFTEERFKKIKNIAERLREKKHAFILGKGKNYYLTLEAALKIKEISYLHAEGFAAGELKHGVIALVEEGTPVFALIDEDDYRRDILSAVAEVKARGAWTLGVGQVGNDLFDDFLKTPSASLATCVGSIIPFQLLAYFLALGYGYDPDKPRNLAKSVTVK